MLPGGPGSLIHVTVQRDRRPSLAGVRIHQSRRLTAADLRIRAGLPVTSPAQTLLDVAPMLSDRRLELALVRAAGLPPPLVNASLLGYEVDFYWPDLERDGYALVARLAAALSSRTLATWSGSS